MGYVLGVLRRVEIGSGRHTERMLPGIKTHFVSLVFDEIRRAIPWMGLSF